MNSVKELVPFRPPLSNDEVRARAKRAIRQSALEGYADVSPSIVRMRNEGMSLGHIAVSLNTDGHRTRRGALYNAGTIHRILGRLNESSEALAV